MPVWKRKELRQQLGLTSAYITQNVKRGKLVPSDNEAKYFDTEVPENDAFISAITAKVEQPLEESTMEPEQPEESEEPPVPEAPESQEAIQTKEFENNPLQPPSGQNKKALEAWKKRLDAEVVRQRAEVLKVQKERMLGENLPREGVQRVLSTMVKTYTEEFKDFAENLLGEFAAIAGLSSEEEARFRDKLYKGLNTSGKKANEEAKRELRNLIKEVEETREKGQSKLNVKNE